MIAAMKRRVKRTVAGLRRSRPSGCSCTPVSSPLRVLALESWCPFVAFSEDRLAGMSCFINVDPDRGVLEIGNTYYVPALRGTGFNRAVKDLMIRRAIVSGFRRIEFKVDRRNARSQAAMAKLGAVREGVIRADRITWTGHVRDTVLFSILASEWDRSSGVHR